MSAAMKAVMQRFFGEVFSRGNLALIEELVSPDYRLFAPPNPVVRGPDGLKRLVALDRRAFPDLHFSIAEQVVDGEWVMTRWSATWTQHGPLDGIPPTGKVAEVMGVTLSRIVAGRLTETWLAGTAAPVWGVARPLAIPVRRVSGNETTELYREGEAS